MDTILFSGTGIFLILLAVFLKNKHKHFMSTSIEVQGEVVDIIEKVHTSRGGLGGVSQQRLRRHPVVKYRYNRFYRFESEMDVADGLKLGSIVTVRINPMQPKAAKLSVSLKQNAMFFLVIAGLGLFFIVIGAVQFKSGDFNFSAFDNWFALGFVVIGSIYLYVKLSPLFNLMKYNSIYTENAVEVDE